MLNVVCWPVKYVVSVLGFKPPSNIAEPFPASILAFQQ